MLTRCLVSTKFDLFCFKSPLYSGLHTIYKIEDKNSSISAALGINQHAEVQTKPHEKAAHTDDDPQVSMEHFRGGIPQGDGQGYKILSSQNQLSVEQDFSNERCTLLSDLNIVRFHETSANTLWPFQRTQHHQLMTRETVDQGTATRNFENFLAYWKDPSIYLNFDVSYLN